MATKPTYVCAKLFSKAEKNNSMKKKKIVTALSRPSTLYPQMEGQPLRIANGHKQAPALGNENMVGHKLGEFAPTRTCRGHSGAKGERAAALKKNQK